MQRYVSFYVVIQNAFDVHVYYTTGHHYHLGKFLVSQNHGGNIQIYFVAGIYVIT